MVSLSADNGELQGSEHFWVTEALHQRWTRARKWEVTGSVQPPVLTDVHDCSKSSYQSSSAKNNLIRVSQDLSYPHYVKTRRNVMDELEVP